MTGQLSGTLDNRPVAISADDNKLEITFSTWFSAWKLRGSNPNVLAPIIQLLNRYGLEVSIVVGGRRIRIAPNPHIVSRFFAPKLYRMLNG